MNDSIVKTFVKAIKAEKKDPSPYDTTAKVTRVEGNTVWVHISGGVDETPVRRTVNAKVGDEVQVRVGGGKAWITGNASSPPTDDATAIRAENTAITANENAMVAGMAATSAVESANKASSAAQSALTSALQAASAAASAQTSANNAQISANNAQTSANNAAEYASRALGGLSTVQSVAETLTWITQHGTMTLTTDVALDPTHVYFVLDPAGDYTVGGNTYAIVTEPNVNDIGTYYELTIDESLNNYVGTHLALTGEGLWLLPASSGTNKVLVATGAGSVYTTAGTYIIDSGGATVASFRANGATMGENMDGKSRSEISTTGMQIYQKVNGADVELANIGYGPGKNQSGGTSNTPHFTFGKRRSNTTIGNYSFATGYDVEASHYLAYAEGNYTSAKGASSHAEGAYTTVQGYAAHVEGNNSIANGEASHAQNTGTVASRKSQTVIGEYNISDTTGADGTVRGQYAFIIGNGDQNTASNALTVDWNGNVNIASGAKYQINGTNLSASDIGAVPTSRTVNNKALSSNISLTASDVSAVPTSRTVNSKALSSNITLTASDVSAISTSDKYTRSSAGDLQWTNQTDGDAKVMAKSGVAFWNGAYNGSSSNLKYSVNGEILGKTNVKDYVTATGSDGIWKYRKWSSGRIECWGEKLWSSVACTTSAGGGYRSADVTQALPSGLFTAIDSCQATMKGSGGSGYAMALRTLCTTTTVTQMFWNTSSATKTNLVVDYYIIGT